MTRLFAGVKPGVGPVLKVMANDTDDPLTTSNTDYAKYRFNSETSAIGYAYDSYIFATNSTAWTGLATAWYYRPSGSTAANCEQVIRYENSTTRVLRITHCYDRISSLANRTILMEVTSRSDWTTNWVSNRTNYPGSTDGRYTSKSNVYINTTDQNEAWGVSVNYGRIDLNIDFGQHVATGKTWSWTGSPNIPIEYSFVETELPIENVAYPSVTGSFVANLKILRLDPTRARMTKPGFDVETATYDQMIFSEEKIPLKIARTGSFTLAAGASTSVSVAFPITSRSIVDTQVNVTGQPLRLPPYPDNGTSELLLQHRIVGQNVEFRNQSTVSLDCRYFILTEDGSSPSSGSAKVVDTQAGYTVIRRPNSAGTSMRDVILDTRASYLPLVSQGWVAASSITTVSDVSRFGSHMYVLNLTNTGWKPFLMAVAKYEVKAAPGKYIWEHLFAKDIEVSSLMSNSTFMSTVTDTQIKFYVDKNNRNEDAYRTGTINVTPAKYTLIGFRYYVFAVPPTL